MKILEKFLAVIVFILISINLYPVAEVRNLIIKPTVLTPGQRVTLTFEHRTTNSFGTAYYAMFSDVCSVRTAGTAGQDIKVSEDGMDVLTVDVNRTNENSQTANQWYPSSTLNSNIYMSVPSSYTCGNYYVIVVVREYQVINGSGGNYYDNYICAPVAVNDGAGCLINNASSSYNGNASYAIKISQPPTNTSTSTRTNTSTNTPTNTITRTFTQTNTYTNTVTNTFTNTWTNTPTHTITNTWTNTRTPTNTITNTPTNTITDTRTYTPTNTITNTRTNTITNTSTNTITNTFTNTITNTFTNTFTLTNTRTNTPTNTWTNTWTVTSTRTFTPTETWTGTPPPTWTPTDTWTNTNTWTPTNTRTNTPTSTDTNTPTNTSTTTNTWTLTFTRTYTNTPTETWTGTLPPTWTPTLTWTNTWTLTDTRTNTPSPTDTSSPTNTSTVTNTRTPTNTWTDTNTYLPTVTNTWTVTNTRTYTNTPTNTNTATDTRTNTATNTAIFTVTETPTHTSTPTITLTLPPFPYMLKIEIYNEAGEKVRTVINTRASDSIKNAILLEGENEANMISNDKLLKIKLPGIETPDTINNGESIFIWDTKNDNGQYVSNGNYYIKISEQDSYGHTDVLIKNIFVLNTEDFVVIKIFNSAGEIVKTITHFTNVLPDRLNLSFDDIIPVEKNGNKILLSYGDDVSSSVIWDGLSDQGILVSSGIYEIQVISKLSNGESKTASKTILILREDDEFLKNIKVYPNPYVYSKVVIFKWDYSTEGELKIKIYNIKGELIRQLFGKLEMGEIKWDLKSATGALVSEGYYYAIMEAKSRTGIINRKTAKFGVIYKKK